MRANSILIIVLLFMAWSSDGAVVNKFRKVPGRDLGNRIQGKPKNETGRGFFLRGKSCCLLFFLVFT